MPSASYPTREALLRTLRLNMVPSPRVISPGPATVFPVVFETPGGEVDVMSLKEVRSGKWSGGFFREVLPVLEKRTVKVSGYGTTSEHPLDGAIKDMAVRAAYCLGFDAAEVEVGLGPGGPWVLDVEETAAPMAGKSPPTFRGARVEYLRIDRATGYPEHKFHAVDFSPGGKPEFPADVRNDDSTWVSSPAPFPEMPLTTRLLFAGVPEPWFVRLLDQTVAVLGMLVSPAEEARERHATDEGLLGSIHLAGDGFEYQTVPSLLWSPVALRGVMAFARAISMGGIPGDAAGPVSHILFSAGGHVAQKAYYNCDAVFFGRSIPAIASILKGVSLAHEQTDAVDTLLRMADEAASARGREEGTGREADLRPAWGLPAPAAAALAGAPARTGGRRLPVLGIMSPMEEGPRRFGIETDRFRELIRIAAAQGVTAYVFYPSPWMGKGWFHRERRGWYEEPAPPPDVVYDRHIPDVLPSGSIADVARDFQDTRPGVQFVNSLELVRACRDKFLAHQILARDPFVANYLPQTVLAESPEAVAAFASQRVRTYLKLRGGTGSRGLTLLESLDDGSFRVTRREAHGQVVMCAGEVREMLAGILNPGPGRPDAEYIAQDGIDLARAPGLGEVFEVRVICQKGGAGKWLRTGMVCRVNPALGRFIIPREELHMRVDDLLVQVFPGRVAEIKDEIREVARRIPPILEAASGPGGEMSVDLGLDTCGRPHLIEVNSKPATLFRDIAAFEVRRLSLRRIVNYAIHLFDER